MKYRDLLVGHYFHFSNHIPHGYAITYEKGKNELISRKHHDGSSAGNFTYPDGNYLDWDVEIVLPTSIKEAALMLDRVHPGWADKININILNMDLSDRCVLGQLYGGSFLNGLEQIFGTKRYSVVDELLAVDTPEWRREIIWRTPKKSPAKLNIVEAHEALKNGKRVALEYSLDSFEDSEFSSEEIGCNWIILEDK
jgi:hypothetical protein